MSVKTVAHWSEYNFKRLTYGLLMECLEISISLGDDVKGFCKVDRGDLLCFVDQSVRHQMVCCLVASSKPFPIKRLKPVKLAVRPVE